MNIEGIPQWLNCVECIKELALSHPPAVASRFASRRSSVSGTMNSAAPQSKQTISCGNTQTAGLSTFFSPGERMPISPMKFFWFADPHDLQGMLAKLSYSPTKRLSDPICICSAHIVTEFQNLRYSQPFLTPALDMKFR